MEPARVGTPRRDDDADDASPRSRAFDADANDDDAHARVGGRERAAVLVALIEREGDDDDDDETTNRWAFDVIPECVRAEGGRAHAGGWRCPGEARARGCV